MPWHRYVAIGDSSTEGLDDPHPAGGYRGWADRLAERLEASHGGVAYANLAVRGRTADRIRAEQLAPALALDPDLISIVAGVNDMLRPTFDPVRLAEDLEAMLGAGVDAGATVVTITWPDPSRMHPAARLLRRRVAGLNAAIRTASERTGAHVLDLAAEPVATDTRLWSDDRLHASSLGHERIADALAQLLGIDGHDGSWARPLPPVPPPAPRQRIVAEAAWLRDHLAPWVARRVRGHSSGDHVTAKRPTLRPVEPSH